MAQIASESAITVLANAWQATAERDIEGNPHFYNSTMAANISILTKATIKLNSTQFIEPLMEVLKGSSLFLLTFAVIALEYLVPLKEFPTQCVVLKLEPLLLSADYVYPLETTIALRVQSLPVISYPGYSVSSLISETLAYIKTLKGLEMNGV